MPGRDFTAVYDQHVWYVYGFFAYRLRGSRADVEDLTQQTFERALRAWDRYDASRASVVTWLMAIARNLLADHTRASRASSRRFTVEHDMEAFGGEPDRPNVGLEPDLERALSTLGDRERELIALRYGGDLSCPEIAVLTGLSLANVQQVLSRSLRRMRASMDPEPAGAAR